MSTQACAAVVRWLQRSLVTAACAVLAACQTYPSVSESQAKRVDLRLQLASAYLDRGQPEVALTEAQRALEVDPGNAQAHNVLAMALLALQRFDPALQAMRQATALAPNDLSLQHNLAWLQCAAGQPEQALQTFEQLLLQAAPPFDVARTQFSQGVCAMQAQQPEVAQRALEHAMQDVRYADAARFGLAKLMVQSQDWAHAMRLLAAMPAAQRATPAVQALQADIDAQFERSKQEATLMN